MTTKEMNIQAARCHADNEHFWRNLETQEKEPRDKAECLALVISELSEALEGERKGLIDDKLPHRLMAEVEMADAVIRLLDLAGGYRIPLGMCQAERPSDLWKGKGKSFCELDDHKPRAIFEIMRMVTKIGDSTVEGIWITLAIHMIEAYCKKHNYDLMGAYEEKIAFNKVREDHKLETRRADGGKKF